MKYLSTFAIPAKLGRVHLFLSVRVLAVTGCSMARIARDNSGSLLKIATQRSHCLLSMAG
jgi:hypothetical protein